MLWGRNWGCVDNFKMLYFEACFYRGIEFAIENGLSKVEAGAQGPHKISRGYLPSATYSAHWIRDEGFREAVLMIRKPVTQDLCRGPVFGPEETGSRHRAGMTIVFQIPPSGEKDLP